MKPINRTTLTAVALVWAAIANANPLYDESNHLDFDSGAPVGPIDLDGPHGDVRRSADTTEKSAAKAMPFAEIDAALDDDDYGHSAQSTNPTHVVNAAYDAPDAMTLSFIFHIDDGLAEQDVFYEKVPGSGEVFRPTAATRDMDAPLYAPAVEVPHNFLDTSDTGPYPKGRPLGLTLGKWFAAEGNGTYTCENGVGEVDFAFRNLVPNGVYTMWHDFMVWPPTDPFIGTYDLPFGARDGSENTFVADAQGAARFQRTITPCLQLSGEHLAADLGVAWHSDGKTYGPLPGEFSTVTHVQLYVALPPRTGL